MPSEHRPYKGMAMEGIIATWYARNTGRNLRRFRHAAEAVTARAPKGGKVLEVAPGPGFLALELTRRGYRVTGLDISHSFVRIAREGAARAGASIDFQQGDAARMPFEDASFDFAVCMAAFKNFTDPVGALDEIHRVLKPGGAAAILDLRREASLGAIEDEVRGMDLSRVDAALTRWTFRFMLLKRAYSQVDLEQVASRSRFGSCQIVPDGIGFEMRLRKAGGGLEEPRS